MKKRPSIRHAAFVSAGVALTLALTSCTGGGGGAAAPEDGGGVGTAEKPVDIYIQSDPSYAPAWKDKLVPEFNKKYPHIKVHIDPVPYADNLSKTLLDLSSTDPRYDIYLLDEPWIPQVASSGALYDVRTDLKEYAADDFDWDDIAPAPLAASEWDDAQFGVPIRSNVLLMFYNRELYKAAGVPEPTPELTWPEFLEQAPQLVRSTDGDSSPDTWAISTYFTRDGITPRIWQPILNANGGKILDADMKVAFDDKKGVEALSTFVDLLQWAPPGASSYNIDEAMSAFKESKVASMFMWGSVYRGVAVDPTTSPLTNGEVGVQTLPVGSEMAGSQRGVWSGTISRHTKNPEAAWKFLEWVASKEGEKWSLANIGQFPARTSTLSSTPPEEWLAAPLAAINDAYDVIDAGQMWPPRLPESDAVNQILMNGTAEATSGQKTPEEAIKQMAGELRKYLESKGYPQG